MRVAAAWQRPPRFMAMDGKTKENEQLMTFDIDPDQLRNVFSQDKLDAIFPAERTNQFFDALFGDADEGAYDIRLTFNTVEARPARLRFDLELRQRPGRCLACNLTYGLPTVFERHPIIDIAGVVEQIDRLMNGQGNCSAWQLERSREITHSLHVVPLVIDIEQPEM